MTSGFFVPSLMSGAAFGRMCSNVIHLYDAKHFSRSNIYSLIGAASVLGGMARMTISLTVILLECTGNEQFLFPLMISLMSERIIYSTVICILYISALRKELISWNSNCDQSQIIMICMLVTS